LRDRQTVRVACATTTASRFCSGYPISRCSDQRQDRLPDMLRQLRPALRSDHPRPDRLDDSCDLGLPISSLRLSHNPRGFQGFCCLRWDLSLQSRLRWRHKHLKCQGEVGQYVPSVQEQAGTYWDKADAAGKD